MLRMPAMGQERESSRLQCAQLTGSRMRAARGGGWGRGRLPHPGEEHGAAQSLAPSTHTHTHRAHVQLPSFREAANRLQAAVETGAWASVTGMEVASADPALFPSVPRHLPSSWSKTIVPRRLQPSAGGGCKGTRGSGCRQRGACAAFRGRAWAPRPAAADEGGRSGARSAAPRAGRAHGRSERGRGALRGGRRAGPQPRGLSNWDPARAKPEPEPELGPEPGPEQPPQPSVCVPACSLLRSLSPQCSLHFPGPLRLPC